MTGIRVDVNANVIITDPNPALSDSATLYWGSAPGDRSNQFVTTPPVLNTTLTAVGISNPGQYHMAATLTTGGVESNESNEVPFELVPMAPILDVQP